MDPERRSLYVDAVCLAPMVRSVGSNDMVESVSARLLHALPCQELATAFHFFVVLFIDGTLPLRLLALRYGADTVWTEEIIDRKISACTRVENDSLNTTDFVASDGKTIVLRTCAEERQRVIFQIGSADSVWALKAAEAVSQDVAGIDLNMGCPKHFSVSGGMGAALLRTPEKACEIVKAWKRNLQIPISAKIRLLSTTADTIQLVRALEYAGVDAVTVHVRETHEREDTAAHWERLEPVVSSAHVPILANGDIYTSEDVQLVRALTKCHGVMLARGALRNPSVFRTICLSNKSNSASPLKYEDQTLSSGTAAHDWDTNLDMRCHVKEVYQGCADVAQAGLLPLEMAVQNYLRIAKQYQNVFQNTKYNVMRFYSEAPSTNNPVFFPNFAAENAEGQEDTKANITEESTRSLLTVGKLIGQLSSIKANDERRLFTRFGLQDFYDSEDQKRRIGYASIPRNSTVAKYSAKRRRKSQSVEQSLLGAHERCAAGNVEDSTERSAPLIEDHTYSDDYFTNKLGLQYHESTKNGSLPEESDLSPFHCDICGLSLQSLKVLESHYKGKKHKRRVLDTESVSTLKGN